MKLMLNIKGYITHMERVHSVRSSGYRKGIETKDQGRDREEANEQSENMPRRMKS